METIYTQSILKDLSSLGVQEKVLNKLVDTTNLCLANELYTAKQKNEQVVRLNIGIGNLVVELSSNQVKFMPSKDLQALLKTAITKQTDPLEITLEQQMIDKLTEMIDEVI